jgi:hypothetical protein
MGLNFSALYAQPREKPKTVLVPPYFERDLKARSRMVKSSYDYLFGKPSLRWLFSDYFGEQLNAVLYFAPSADPRISVKAKLGASDAGEQLPRLHPQGYRIPARRLCARSGVLSLLGIPALLPAGAAQENCSSRLLQLCSQS